MFPRINLMKCLVPSCPNTSKTAPQKIFVFVPKKRERRRKWCQAIGFSGTDMPFNHHLNVCEDHFDLAQDTVNWMFYKTMGNKLVFRKDVVPHKNLTENKAGPESQMTKQEKKTRDEAIKKFKQGAARQANEMFEPFFEPEIVVLQEMHSSLETFLGLCEETVGETQTESVHHEIGETSLGDRDMELKVTNLPKHQFSQYVSEAIFFDGTRAWWHRPKKPFRCWENTPEKYTCGKCILKTNLRMLLKQHTDNVHKGGKFEPRALKIRYNLKTYRCARCDFHTISAFLWLGHFRMHGNRNERQGS